MCQYNQPPLCINISILADLTDEPAEHFQVIIGGNQTMRLDDARVIITDSGTDKGSLIALMQIHVRTATVKVKVMLYQ